MTYPQIFYPGGYRSDDIFGEDPIPNAGTKPKAQDTGGPVIPITRPVTEYYPEIGVTLPALDTPIPVQPNLIPKKPVNTQTPNVPFPQLEYMAWKTLQTQYLGGENQTAQSVLRFLDSQYPDLAAESREYIAEGVDLVNETENFLSSTEYDDKTIERLSKAFPAVKQITSLDLPFIPDMVAETIIGAMKGTIWTLITGEDPPPYVINSATALENKYLAEMDRIKDFERNELLGADRGEWYQYETGALRSRWSKSLEDAQLTAIEMLAVPILVPGFRVLASKIMDFLKFQKVSGTLQDIKSELSGEDGEEKTVINETTTNVYEGDTYNDDGSGGTPPPSEKDLKDQITYPLPIAPVVSWAFDRGPKYTGGGGTVARKGKAQQVPSYCSALVKEALNTGDYSIVPPECRVLLEGKVGTNGIQGSVGTYPVLSTRREPSKVLKRRGNR
jgi:hypothetical protein